MSHPFAPPPYKPDIAADVRTASTTVIRQSRWTQEQIDAIEREANELLVVFGEMVNAKIVDEPAEARP